jgi:hypothetical protein
METAKHIIIVSMFVLLISATVLSTPADPNISYTSQASCIVQVSIDNGILPFRSDEIVSLISSSGVLGKAAREVLDTTADKVEISTQIKYPSDKGNMVTYPIELSIKLEDKIKPAANEFLKAIVENLRESLKYAFDNNHQEFRTRYETATHQYNDAESQLKKLSDEAATVGVTYSDASREDSQAQRDLIKQLEKIVKLPDFAPDMTLEEVLQVIAHSVEPPLQVQPNWKDLADNGDILPTTPAEMSPFNSVKIGKALDVLMECLSSELAELGYTTDDGVITISTKKSLKPKVYFSVYDISGLLINGRTSNSIIQAIKETIEPDSWYDENGSITIPVSGGGYGGVGYGITHQVQTIKTGQGNIADIQGGKILVSNTPRVHEKIQKFLVTFPKEIPSEPVESIPLNILTEEKLNLGRQKRGLEMDLARLEARQGAIEKRIKITSDQVVSTVKDDASLNQLKRNLDMLLDELEVLKKTMTDQNPEVKKRQDQIAKIREQIASNKDEDTITSELMRLIETQTQQLAIIRQEFEVGRRTPSELALAEEKLVQAKIQLAKRREELGKAAGGEQLSMLNNELSEVMLNLTEKKAEFQVIEKQLGELESQIQAVSTTDPKILKIRQARKAFEEAEKRLNELKAIEANLRPPQVIAIGME